MNETRTIDNDPRLLEEKFVEAVTRIQERQYEIEEIREQLQMSIDNAKKHSYPKGEIVSFDKLLMVKKISELLCEKEEENKQAVLDLYHSVFSDDIFISQDYYEVWISLRPNTIIKFSDDLSCIEVKVVSDLN